MKCPACGHENRPDFKFCSECGNELIVEQPAPDDRLVCKDCGHENQPDYNFCEECGSQLMVAQPAPDNRLVCKACGHANQPDFNFCEECGSQLIVGQPAQIQEEPPAPVPELSPRPRVRVETPRKPQAKPEPVRTRSKTRTPGYRRRSLGSFLGTLLGTLLIALLTAVISRYGVPFLLDIVLTPQTANISEGQAIRLTDNFIRADYPDFLGLQPATQLAQDGLREVYVVSYTRTGATLAVLVDAYTGSTTLLPPDQTRPVR